MNKQEQNLSQQSTDVNASKSETPSSAAPKGKAEAPKSFRITQEVYERFRQLQQDMGSTQDRMLSMLIDAYELEHAKDVMPGQSVLISNFQDKVNDLLTSYLNCMQLGSETEVRVRKEYDRRITDMENMIHSLQERINDLTNQKAVLSEELANCRRICDLAVKRAESAEKGLQTAEKTIEKAEQETRDKEDLLSMMYAREKEARQRADKVEQLREDLINSEKRISELQSKFDADLSSCRSDAEADKTKMQFTIDQLTASLQQSHGETDLVKRQYALAEKMLAQSEEMSNKQLQSQKAEFDAILSIERNKIREELAAKYEEEMFQYKDEIRSLRSLLRTYKSNHEA